MARLVRVGAGDADRRHRQGDEVAGHPRAVLRERHLEDPGDAGHARGRERVVPDKVAHRVGDQPAAVPLHPAQDVRAAARDEIGARAHDRVREGDRVPAVLAEEPLRPRPDVLVVGALGAGVHRHDHDVRPRVGLAHEPLGGRKIQQRLRPRVRREAEHRDADPAHVHVRDLARPPRRQQPRLPDGRDRVGLPGRAVVERVVVGEVHHREPRLPEERRIRDRRPEREAARAARGALGGAALGQRPLEVPEHDVAGEVEADCLEVRLGRPGDHRDVAGDGEPHDRGRFPRSPHRRRPREREHGNERGEARPAARPQGATRP